MSHIKLDVPKEEIKEIELIPNGEIVTLQLTSEPEIGTSQKESKSSYLSFTFDVVEARKPEWIDQTIFHIATIPTAEFGKYLEKEGKKKGWKLIKSEWAKLTAAFDVDPTDFDTRRLIGKKIEVSIGREEYQGKEKNVIKEVLGAK